MSEEKTIANKLYKIEDLKLKNKTSEAVFEGAKLSVGWKTGKMVSEDEYIKAIETFLKKPISGKEVKTSAKRR
jgi:hypothetical protein